MSDFSNERPPLGEIKAGDEVIVETGNWHRGTFEPIKARISKASRVWIELVEISDKRWRHSWRMRRDTQNAGNKDYPQNGDRFLTPEQYSWEQKLKEANDALRAVGIRIDPGTALDTPASRVWLSVRIWAGER